MLVLFALAALVAAPAPRPPAAGSALAALAAPPAPRPPAAGPVLAAAPAPRLPAATSAARPLAAGPATIEGMIVENDGPTVLLLTRAGTTIVVDPRAALAAAGRNAPTLTPRRIVVVRGIVGGDAVLRASAIVPSATERREFLRRQP